MIPEQDSQLLSKPLTCGGGSGIVQSTKALILKSEYKRMGSEISKLKQQNEQLRKQNNQLLSDNSQLSNEVKTWEERTLKRDSYRETTCENSPKSPKVNRTDSKRRIQLLNAGHKISRILCQKIPQNHGFLITGQSLFQHLTRSAILTTPV